MTDRLLRADDIISIVQDKIDELGIDAFVNNGRVQLYSGPAKFIADALHDIQSNRLTAIAQADRQQSIMIDHTEVGKFLTRFNEKGIYNYFIEHYVQHIGVRGRTAGFVEADKVMREVSRRFIRASFGHVATAVCGAGRDRIFFQEELPELVDNQLIETINDIEAGRIRHIFHDAGHYAAFRKICQAEVLLAYRQARQVDEKEKSVAWEDYQTRRRFFMLERRATITQMQTLKQAEDYLAATSEFIYGDSPRHPSYVPYVKMGGSGLH